MVTATPTPSPNPDALKFELDVSLPDTISFKSTDEARAAGNGFGEAVLAIDGVVSVFGVNDFVTVTRVPGTEWDGIIAAVQRAASAHL